MRWLAAVVRAFNAVDDFNREVFIEVDTSINSGHVARIFRALKCDLGLPLVLCSDNARNSSTFPGLSSTTNARLAAMASYRRIP